MEAEAAASELRNACMSSMGISPLVASVLLIAITMTIAGVLAYWSTSFVRTSLPEVNATTSECTLANFAIYSCNYENSTSTLNIILENLENIQLSNLRVFVVYTNTSLSDAIPLNSTLTSGLLKSFSLTGMGPSFSKILVKTQCPELNKEKVCTRS